MFVSSDWFQSSRWSGTGRLTLTQVNWLAARWRALQFRTGCFCRGMPRRLHCSLSVPGLPFLRKSRDLLARHHDIDDSENAGITGRDSLRLNACGEINALFQHVLPAESHSVPMLPGSSYLSAALAVEIRRMDPGLCRSASDRPD